MRIVSDSMGRLLTDMLSTGKVKKPHGQQSISCLRKMFHFAKVTVTASETVAPFIHTVDMYYTTDADAVAFAEGAIAHVRTKCDVGTWLLVFDTNAADGHWEGLAGGSGSSDIVINTQGIGTDYFSVTYENMTEANTLHSHVLNMFVLNGAILSEILATTFELVIPDTPPPPVNFVLLIGTLHACYDTPTENEIGLSALEIGDPNPSAFFKGFWMEYRYCDSEDVLSVAIGSGASVELTTDNADPVPTCDFHFPIGVIRVNTYNGVVSGCDWFNARVRPYVDGYAEDNP